MTRWIDALESPAAPDEVRSLKDALRGLLASVEPFRAFRNDSDELVARVADMPGSPGDSGPRLARLEHAARRALAAVS